MINPLRTTERRLAAVLISTLTLVGCAGGNRAASDPQQPEAVAPTHIVMVPHPGGNHVGGDDPFEMDPQ